MTIQRIESLTYGAEDAAEGTRYFEDWGLETVEKGQAGAVFRTPENQTIHVRSADDPGLPPSPLGGSAMYQTTWGVDSKQSLEAIGAELEKDRAVTADSDGVIHAADETGFAIAFRLSDRTPARPDAPQVNRNDDVTAAPSSAMSSSTFPRPARKTPAISISTGSASGFRTGPGIPAPSCAAKARTTTTRCFSPTART